MKKILLLAAFGVAGFVSANDLSVKENTIKEKSQKEAVAPKEEVANKTKAAASCVPVSYSCGVSGWACGGTVMEMIVNAWDGDSLFCGN